MLAHVQLDVSRLLSSYLAHANPRFGEVDKQAILGPSSGSGDFLEGEVGSVLLEVDLGNQGNGVDYKISRISLDT